MHQVTVGLILLVTRLNRAIAGSLQKMTSTGDHTVIETRNMSAETRLQTASAS
jgi:hypothetical protein